LLGMPMPIQFQCQSCRSTLRVPDNLAGRKVKCPKCAGVADVPASDSRVEQPQPVMQSSAEAEEVGVRAPSPAKPFPPGRFGKLLRPMPTMRMRKNLFPSPDTGDSSPGDERSQRANSQ